MFGIQFEEISQLSPKKRERGQEKIAFQLESYAHVKNGFKCR